MTTAVCISAASAEPASRSDARDFEIEAQSLPTALSDFARQSGRQISLESGVGNGRDARAVSGTYSIDEALQQLLGGTGLTWRSTSDGAIVIEQAPNQSGAMLLDRVLVEAGETQAEVSEDDRAYKTAGSSTYISQEKIERFRGTSVGDVFQGIPGVLIGENRNSGGLDVNIRGMQGQGRVPVLVDGARQETTVYRGYAGVSSRSYVDPDLIGGINIEKGPSMSAQGTGAIGGIVSMRTVSANDIIKDDEKGWGVRIRGSGIGNNTGSAIAEGTPSGYTVGGDLFTRTYRINCEYDCSKDALPDPLAPSDGMNRPGLLDFKGWSGSIATAKRFEHVDLVAAYAQRQQGNYYAGKHGPAAWVDLSDTQERGFWTDVTPKLMGASRFRAGERIANTEFESRSLLLKSTFYLPKEQNLEVGFLNYDSEYGEMMPSMLIRFGQVFQAPSSTVDANTWTSRYQWNPTDDDWLDLRANLWRTDTESRNVNYPDEQVELSPNLADMMGTERYVRWGFDLSNTMRFDWIGSLEWRYGLAWQQEDVGPADRDEQGAESVRDGERKEFSVFTAFQWKPWPSLTFDAGLRWSDFSAHDRSPAFVPDEDSTQCIDLDEDGACDQLSVHDTASRGGAPIASLTWEPYLKGLQFYASYAEALRMPSMFESTRGFSAAQAFDVAIKPEHAYNREVGINLLRDGVLAEKDKLRVKAAYFRNVVRDYLTRTSPNLWEESAYTGQFFTLRNIKKASFYGYELNIDYDAGWLFWTAAGTRYSKIETCHYGSYRRYECTDYGLANSYINNMIPPQWHASTTLGTRLFDQRWTLGMRATFMGQRTRQPEYEDDTTRGFLAVVPWHSYRLLDLFTSYRFNDRVSADFNVDNLTDRYYLDALSLGLVPAPGRTARLSLTLQF